MKSIYIFAKQQIIYRQDSITLFLTMELQLIQNKIYEIRGQRVMLDVDLAELYKVETKNLNLSVKRNIKRFPPDFMFQLNPEEWDSLRLQIETSKRGGRRYLPYAFTEHGVTMFSKLEAFMIETNMQFCDIYQALTEMASQNEKENKPLNPVGFLAYNKN